MLKIAVVDDEKHALERFETVAGEMENISICGLFDDHEEFLSYVKKEQMDIVFLDIEMPGTNGMELAEELLNWKPELGIVFVTAYNQYAVEAFELNAVDYILKPITKARLEKTLSRIVIRKPLQETTVKKAFIQCFKRFECRIDGEVCSLQNNSKVKELLAFLVDRGGASATWEQITECLWQDADYEKAHNNLYITTYRLRKWLTEIGLSHIFECKRNNYRVIPSAFDCDLYEMQQAEKIRNLERLNSFYTGEYLEEEGYEWAYPKQAEWARKMQKYGIL